MPGASGGQPATPRGAVGFARRAFAACDLDDAGRLAEAVAPAVGAAWWAFDTAGGDSARAALVEMDAELAFVAAECAENALRDDLRAVMLRRGFVLVAGLGAVNLGPLKDARSGPPAPSRGSMARCRPRRPRGRRLLELRATIVHERAWPKIFESQAERNYVNVVARPGRVLIVIVVPQRAWLQMIVSASRT